MQMADTPYQFPDPSGHFGPYGGVFVAETLMPALTEGEAASLSPADIPAPLAAAWV